MQRSRILGFAALLAGAWPAGAAAPSSDVTLQPVITDNLPVITSITAYGKSDSDATSGAFPQVPMFAPWDCEANSPDPWWDNLVSEQLQARLPVVMLSACGSHTTNPADRTGPGDMNARNLDRYVAALQRAGASSVLKLGCFAEAAAQGIYNRYYNQPGGSLADFANQDSWNQVWWLRIVKPWFETIPSSYWAKVNGRVPIEFWGLGIKSIYANQEGNVSQMLNFLDAQLFSTHGVHACFILGDVNYDTTLANLPAAMGNNMWFSPPSTSFTMTNYKGKVWGGIAAGFINWRYYDPGDPYYQDPKYVIRRNRVDGTGANGDTLKAGLDAAVSNNAVFSIIEGWINKSEYNGLYRSATAPEWDYPNQYINIVRSYTDLRTVTLRLEAEAADAYGDTTAGNSGGAFLRPPEDLDVRPLTGARAMTASSEASTSETAAQGFDGNIDARWRSAAAAPGWIQYDYGSRNAAVVNGYYVCSSTLGQQYDPKDWQLQGSSDGATWTTLDARVGEAFAARQQANYYAFSNSLAYRFYRLSVSAVSGGGSNAIALGELRLMRASSQGGGWAVTNTAPNEWIEFKNLSFSPGNYRFPIRYSSATAGHAVRLLLDGAALPDVTLPATGSADVFDTISLGQKTLSGGLHTLRVVFVDGGVDLDWLFVKKCDPLISFKASNGSYVCAEKGGNDVVVANRASIGIWERFSADDLNGGGLAANDTVNLQAYNGLLLCAESAGGGPLSANRRRAGSFEQFTILKQNGSGAVVNGDTVALRTSNGHYVTAGAGGVLDATGTSIGAAQTFTVTLGAQ